MAMALQADAAHSSQDGIPFPLSANTGDLTDLAPIELEDAGIFLDAAENVRAKAAAYYFPHLLFSAKSKARALRWERHGGSILLYQIRRQKGEEEMRLYCPPFPFDTAALRHAAQRMRDFNGDRSSRILFVPEDDALRVAREGFAITLKSEEFIYDRAEIAALQGAKFGKVRQEVSRCIRRGVETRPYTPADQAACLALAEAWKERLLANGMKVAAAHNVTVTCLTEDRLPSSMLTGLVAELDGKLCGFGFSGSMTSTMGCNYTCVTDLSAPGLTLLLRHRIMAMFPDLIHFNDADDAGRPELRSAKLRLHPVELYGIYKAMEH